MMIISNDVYWILSAINIANMMIDINHDVLAGEVTYKQQLRRTQSTKQNIS